MLIKGIRCKIPHTIQFCIWVFVKKQFCKRGKQVSGLLWLANLYAKYFLLLCMKMAKPSPMLDTTWKWLNLYFDFSKTSLKPQEQIVSPLSDIGAAANCI